MVNSKKNSRSEEKGREIKKILLFLFLSVDITLEFDFASRASYERTEAGLYFHIYLFFYITFHKLRK
jgi:hypothetical protein